MQRTNADIFKGHVFDLPKSRSEFGMIEFLDSIFTEFLTEIANFDGALKKQLLPKIPFIERQIMQIKRSLEFYLQGFPAVAYLELSAALTLLLEENYLPLQSADDSYASPLYRVRVSNSKTMKKEDLFHIPFELREKVSTQRYSIPGLPCLYLADSVFVCWEELGRPHIDSFHVARVDLSQSKLRFLYLNTSANDIRKQCFTSKCTGGKLLNLLVPFLCNWPLLLACSVVVQKPDEIFKPEYIIPQLLLQWVVSAQKVDGIVYRSNRIKISNHNIGTFFNVAIPVKKISNHGFCTELKSKIKITVPISYQVLQMTGKKPTSRPIDISALRRAMYIELIEGEKSVYSETTFGKLEEKLDSLLAKKIS